MASTPVSCFLIFTSWLYTTGIPEAIEPVLFTHRSRSSGRKRCAMPLLVFTPNGRLPTPKSIDAPRRLYAQTSGYDPYFEGLWASLRISPDPHTTVIVAIRGSLRRWQHKLVENAS